MCLAAETLPEGVLELDNRQMPEESLWETDGPPLKQALPPPLDLRDRRDPAFFPVVSQSIWDTNANEIAIKQTPSFMPFRQFQTSRERQFQASRYFYKVEVFTGNER